MKSHTAILGFGLALLLVGFGLPVRAGKIDQLDFNLKVQTLDGQDVTLGAFRNKIVFLNFWASWCGPCRQEMPDFDRFYKAYRDRGVVVIGISVDATRGDARKFLERIPVSYPIFWAGPDGAMTKRYAGVPFLPMTVVYDRAGRRVKTLIGPRTLKDLEDLVQPLLKK